MIGHIGGIFFFFAQVWLLKEETFQRKCAGSGVTFYNILAVKTLKQIPGNPM